MTKNRKKNSLLPTLAESAPTQELLQKVLNTPHLPQVLERLPPHALIRLIQVVGVEDATEILEYLKPAQLIQVLEEDLWQTSRAGAPEKFNTKQAMRWLRVWNELGPEHTVAALKGLGHEFLATLIAFYARVSITKGVAWELLDIDGYGSPLEEKNTPFQNIYDPYTLTARRQDEDQWKLFIGVIDMLWEDAPDLLEDALELCCNRSLQDEADDFDGALTALRIEEMLREELAYAREERRKAAGYVNPDDARRILRDTRAEKGVEALCAFIEKTQQEQQKALRTINQSMDAFTATHENSAPAETQRALVVRDLETHPAEEELMAYAQEIERYIFAWDTLKPKHHALTEGEKNLEFSDLDSMHQEHASHHTAQEQEESLQHRPLQDALLNLYASPGELDKISQTIITLANLVAAGCNACGKRLEHEKAFEAALHIVELGLEKKAHHYHLPERSVPQAFAKGLQILHTRVALPAAIALDALVRSRALHCEHLHYRWVQASLKRRRDQTSFAQMLREYRFFDALDLLKALELALPANLYYILLCLISDFPVFPELLDTQSNATVFELGKPKRSWRFIKESDLETLELFLQKIEDYI